MDFQVVDFFNSIIDWFARNGIKIIVILVIMVVSLRTARTLSAKLFEFFSKYKDDAETQKRTQTLSSVVRYTLNVVIYVVSVMMLLRTMEVDLGPIFAAAGVVGLAVGIGAQGLVRDIISGFFILLEDQIRVGDIVSVAGVTGLVEKINLRMLILRDANGTVHYIRNDQINIVSNMTKEFSRYVFDIGVSYREDVDEVMKVLRDIDEEIRQDPLFANDIIEPLDIMGVDKFADSAVIIKARITTKPICQWRIGREYNRRIKKTFDARNIEIPFPHVTLYMGKEKNGNITPEI